MEILVTRFPLASALHGGAENQTVWLSEGLAALGHRLKFLGSCPVLLERFSAIGAVEHLGIGPPPVTKWGAVSFLWRRRTMQRRLIQSFDRLIVDRSSLTAVFMLSLSEKLLLTEWAAKRGSKVFWIEHDRIGTWLRWNPWLSALRRASAFATIVCVSELSKKQYVQLGFDPKGIVVIPNGVPFSATSPEHRQADRSSFCLGCVARLSPEKGIDVLLQAIMPIPEITLTIVGRGPEEGYIRMLIAEDTQRIGVQRITLVPTLKDLHEFYNALDALVLPSVDHDPFGLVAAEAMMRGIPVVVTNACGIADSLQNGRDAIVVKAGAVSELSAALKSLTDSALRERIAHTGRETAHEKFSLERMVEKYEKLLVA